MESNTFGKTLRTLRVDEKKTQDWLAQQLKVTNRTIGHWEAGRCEPDLDELIKICKIFAVSTDYILGTED